MRLPTSETICALATAAGPAGIAVIRVSGDGAFEVCDTVLHHPKPCSQHASHTLHRAQIHDDTGDIDDCLVAIFKAPASYTGENVVELSCHGGPIVVGRALSALLEKGARMADPGEFTLRAFLNAKMDLAQAEAVCDLVSARTQQAQVLALQQERGELSAAIGAIRERLLGVLASIEASIDFPEDVGEWDFAQLARLELTEAQTALRMLFATADSGILLREGLRVVITGRPNVGKSSLMNRLLRSERAIVTSVPGTTRDVLAESVSIAGIPIVLCDTAGIHDSTDEVELIGIERALQNVSEADIALEVLDCSGGALASNREPSSAFKRSTLRVWNKCDLCPNTAVPEGDVRVSALTGEGIDALEAAIANLAMSRSPRPEGYDGPVVTRSRHKSCLEAVLQSVGCALSTLADRLPADLVSIDVQRAITALGEITGQTTPEDIVDEIFSRFCIGK